MLPDAMMHAFFDELAKIAALGGTTPRSRLTTTQHIGLPKSSAPPGPSIAQVAKPVGDHFGSGIAGAKKNTI